MKIDLLKSESKKGDRKRHCVRKRGSEGGPQITVEVLFCGPIVRRRPVLTILLGTTIGVGRERLYSLCHRNLNKICTRRTKDSKGVWVVREGVEGDLEWSSAIQLKGRRMMQPPYLDTFYSRAPILSSSSSSVFKDSRFS